MKKIAYQAFTLVELIVVITILAILATIGFTSFIGYQNSARESTRLSDVKLIEKQLSLYEVQNDTIPLPDNAVTITASGTTIGYQGEIGTGVLVSLRQAGDIKDPLDATRYSYFVDTARQNYQIMAMMENETSLRTGFIPKTYADVDYSERYLRIFGVPLGILTDLDQTPLEKIPGVTTFDIVNYSGTGFTAHYSDTETITGTGRVLQEIIQNSSCMRIRQLSNSEDGAYTINPKMLGAYEVYCDMTTDGGGWTATTMLAGTLAQNLFDTGTSEKVSSITESVSTKGNIEDIWGDNSDKDIMIQCFTQNEMFQPYTYPFIIYDYKKDDIGNLTRQAKANTEFSSVSLQGYYNGYNFTLDRFYGGSSRVNSMYLRTTGPVNCFFLNRGQRLLMSGSHNSLCPGYRPGGGNNILGLSSSNYCVTFIR